MEAKASKYLGARQVPYPLSPMKHFLRAAKYMATVKECVAWHQQPSENTEESTKCIPPHLSHQLVGKVERTQGCKNLGNCTTQDLPGGMGNGGWGHSRKLPQFFKAKEWSCQETHSVHFGASMGEMNIIVTGIFISVFHAMEV